MSFTLFLIVLIVVILALPIWPYSRAWGQIPAAIIAILAIVLLIIILKTMISIDVESDSKGTTIKIEKRE